MGRKIYRPYNDTVPIHSLLMTHTRKRFIFEQAQPQDGKELLAILEDSAFKGNISLLYTRRPDAYQSLRREAEEVDIVVARDLIHGKIVGFGACAIRKLFVNGKATKVGYLFGLRAAREYLGKSPILHRGYEFLHSLHKTKDLSCYITTILEDNLYAQKLLEKRRRCMPAYKPFGSYEVFAMKTAQSRRLSYHETSSFASLHFRQAHKDDLPDLVQFLNEQGKKYQFFPVIKEKDFQPDNFLNLSIKDFYLLHTENKKILAAGVPWNQQDYKQYVVQRYGGVLKLLYPFSRIFPLFGFPALPAPRSLLKFFTLSFWAVQDNNPVLFLRFLDGISKNFKNYPFFLIGLHERQPLRHILQKRPHISYSSKVYLVVWDEQRDCIQNFNKEMLPYLECGML